MGRGAGQTDATAALLRPALDAEEIRSVLRGRGRAPKPRQAYRHLTLTVYPERDDHAYAPSTKADALGLTGRCYEPADGTWHGGGRWLADTSVAYRKVIPGHARRREGFSSETELDRQYEDLVEGSRRAVAEHLAHPVTFGAPEEWELAFTSSKWLRPVGEADGTPDRGMVQVGADELAHLAQVMPDGQWRMTSSYGPHRLILVRDEQPIAILACRRPDAGNRRIR